MNTEPKLLTEAEALELYLNLPRADYIAALRERGLIAPQPVVDPVKVAAREVVGDLTDVAKEPLFRGDYDTGLYVSIALAALKRGMELQREAAPLTRDMVREAVKDALRNTDTVVEFDDFLSKSPISCRNDAENFVIRLHASLNERIQS